MLASVFKHRSLDISNNSDISDLIKSFESSRTRRPGLVDWNLDVVLSWLSKANFEPLNSASLKDLTKKTLFLVALASAGRISELQAMSKEIGFTQDEAVCAYTQDFLAKNEDPSRPWPRFFSIRSLSGVVGEEDEERYLCPVRALKFYLHKTEALRGSSNRLWCSVKDPSRPMSKNAISFFLRSLIQEHTRQ